MATVSVAIARKACTYYQESSTLTPKPFLPLTHGLILRSDGFPEPEGEIATVSTRLEIYTAASSIGFRLLGTSRFMSRHIA